MISAFGVEHGDISKAQKRMIDPEARLPHAAGNILPASTVRAYDNSRKNKPKAATYNFASQVLPGMVGSAVGLEAASLLLRKKPGLIKPIKLKVPSTKKVRTGIAVDSKGTATPKYRKLRTTKEINLGDRQEKVLGLVTAGGIGTLSSLTGSQLTSNHIKRSKRFDYQDRKL